MAKRDKTIKKEMKLGKARNELCEWFCAKNKTIQELVPPISEVEQRTKSRCETMFVRMLETMMNEAIYFKSYDQVYYRNLNITTRRIMKKMILSFTYDDHKNEFISADIPVFFPPLQVENKAVPSEGMFFCNFIHVDSSNLEEKKDYQIQSADIIESKSYDTSKLEFLNRCIQAYDMLVYNQELTVQQVMKYFFLGFDSIINDIKRPNPDISDRDLITLYESGLELTTR